MTGTSAPPWQHKRTHETCQVEQVLLKAGFEKVDAYRYNSASIRVRVIDSRFEGRSLEERDRMVEPHLDSLPERTQADIMNLFTFAPSELQRTAQTSRESLLNTEFEHPSPSML